MLPGDSAEIVELKCSFDCREQGQGSQSVCFLNGLLRSSIDHVEREPEAWRQAWCLVCLSFGGFGFSAQRARNFLQPLTWIR